MLEKLIGFFSIVVIAAAEEEEVEEEEQVVMLLKNLDISLSPGSIGAIFCSPLLLRLKRITHKEYAAKDDFFYKKTITV